MIQTEINKVPKSQWIKLFNQRQKRKKAASSVPKDALQETHFTFGDMHGITGNERKQKTLHTAGMLHATTSLIKQGEVSAKAFNEDWKQGGRGKGRGVSKLPNYRFRRKLLSLDSMVYRENRKLNKKNQADPVNIQNRLLS